MEVVVFQENRGDMGQGTENGSFFFGKQDPVRKPIKLWRGVKRGMATTNAPILIGTVPETETFRRHY